MSSIELPQYVYCQITVETPTTLVYYSVKGTKAMDKEMKEMLGLSIQDFILQWSRDRKMEVVWERSIVRPW